MRQKVLQGGWPHRPPRGYALIRSAKGQSNAIEVHPKDGPLMRQAFELYATGWYSVRTLADRLAKAGLVARNGKAIPQAHLRRLLASSFYAGFVRWHTVECPGTHPALISRALFDKVQQVIRQRFKNPGPKGSVIGGFLLRGLAICASCRGRMTAERHGRWGYYRCSRQTFRRELCAARFCNVDRAHAGVERICREIKIDRELATSIAEAAKVLITSRVTERAFKQKHLSDEKSALLETEMRLTAAFTAGDVAPNIYHTRIGELRAKRQALDHFETSAPPPAEHWAESVNRTLQLATSFGDLYEPMNEMRRTALLRNLFAVVVLDHKGVAGFTLKPPFADLMKSTDGQRNPDRLAKVILDAA
jgi:site-specific DNA recombinase